MLESFVRTAMARGLHVEGICAIQHGKNLGEFRFTADRPRQLHSLSKSFVSMAIGLLIEEGALSLSDRVIDRVAEDKLPDTINENLAALSVRDLLTMSSGHEKSVLLSGDRELLIQNGVTDWVKAYFAAPFVRRPGEKFVYDSGCTYILSYLIRRVTGENVREFLLPRLFRPMGMGEPQWDTCPMGISFGGAGLHLRTEQIARFGQMLLQKGVWNGERLIPEAWIAQASAVQIDNADNDGGNDSRVGYGYQFWMNTAGGYRADGAFGQFAIVLPELDAVVAINAQHPSGQPILDAVWETVIPELEKNF